MQTAGALGIELLNVQLEAFPEQVLRSRLIVGSVVIWLKHRPHNLAEGAHVL
jgi:hypothetical protein